MIHTGILREAENASSALNINKLSSSEQKPRIKTKALGDVQNTLHSRFGNSVNANTGSEVKVSKKPSFNSKSVINEKVLCGKSKASGKNVNVTPTKSAKKIFVSTPIVDDEIFEAHNHILCEQDHQFNVNDFLKEYKFSEEQINHLVCSAKSSKSFVTPITVELFEPCEDIEIPDVKKVRKNSFTVNDILNDVITLSVPAPLEMF